MSTYEHTVDNQESNYELAERVMYGSSRLGINVNKVAMLDENPEEILSLTLGNKLYEMSNHLGNILTVINDIKVPHSSNTVDVDSYLATIVSTADYSPFGVQLDGRTVSAESYRWGFQGQETDNEIKGNGNSVNYTFRMHDPRVGRFFAVDPLVAKYPYNSPYAFSENVVISHVELEGLEKASPEAFKAAEEKLDVLEQKVASGEMSSETLILDGSGNKVPVMTVIASLRQDLADASTATCNKTGGKWFCGKNALQNVALQYDPEGYVDFIMDLAMTGEARWDNKGAKTTLDETLTTTGLDGNVNISGEIFGKSLNFSTKDKSLLRKCSGQLRRDNGNTHPFEMRRMAKRVGLGIERKKIYRKLQDHDLLAMEFAYADRLITVVLDNRGVGYGTPDKADKLIGIHYLAFQSFRQDANGKFDITWNDYGSDKNKQRSAGQLRAGVRAYFIFVKR